MRIANENLIITAVSMGADFQTRALWLGHICNYSIQLVITGSPVGSLSLQYSNDPGMPDGGMTPQALNVSNWTTDADSTQAAAAGTIFWNIANAGYTWVRVSYVSTSGTGSLTSARANVKGV